MQAPRHSPAIELSQPSARAASLCSCLWFQVLLGTGLISLAWCLDNWVVDLLGRPIPSLQLQGVLHSLRCWGDGATLVVLALGVGLARPDRWRVPIQVLLITLLCAGLVELIKPMVNRPRPEEVLLAPAGVTPQGSGWNSSFPSGHATTAFAFARALSLAYPSVQPACLLAASGTSLSRMFVRRHYLSDCVAGAVLSWLLAGVAWRAIQRADDRLVDICRQGWGRRRKAAEERVRPAPSPACPAGLARQQRTHSTLHQRRETQPSSA